MSLSFTMLFPVNIWLQKAPVICLYKSLHTAIAIMNKTEAHALNCSRSYMWSTMILNIQCFSLLVSKSQLCEKLFMTFLKLLRFFKDMNALLSDQFKEVRNDTWLFTKTICQVQ